MTVGIYDGNSCREVGYITAKFGSAGTEITLGLYQECAYPHDASTKNPHCKGTHLKSRPGAEQKEEKKGESSVTQCATRNGGTLV